MRSMDRCFPCLKGTYPRVGIYADGRLACHIAAALLVMLHSAIKTLYRLTVEDKLEKL